LIIYPYPFSLKEKLKNRINIFSFTGRISDLGLESKISPLFKVDGDELLSYGQNDEKISQIIFQDALKETKKNHNARVSEYQHPFIVAWDYEGFVHWDKVNKTVDLALNELQIISLDDPETPFIKQQPIDLQLRLNELIQVYNDGNYIDAISILSDFLSANYEITEFLKFNIDCLLANSYRMIGENEKSVKLFSRIEKKYLNVFSKDFIDYLNSNHIKISETTDRTWDKGVFNWDVGTVHYYWAYSLYEHKQYQDALLHFHKSVEFRRNSPIVDDYINSLTFVGIVYENLADFELSIKIFNDAINYLEQGNYRPQLMIMPLYRSVLVNLRIDNFDEAIRQANRAQALSEKAIEFYSKCLSIQIRINDQRIYRIYFNLIMSYMKLGSIDQATSLFRRFEILVKEYEQIHHRYLKAAQHSLVLSKVRINSFHDPVSRFDDAQELYLDVINDPEVNPVNLMHGYIHYINILLTRFEMTYDPPIIKDLKFIITKLLGHANQYNLPVLRVKGKWLLYKIAVYEKDNQEANRVIDQIVVMTTINNLDELNKRILKDADDYKKEKTGIQLTSILLDDIQYERYRLVITTS
jgi:tetratricopeptide (TPR) repeat protein